MPGRRCGPGLLLHASPDTGKELAALTDRFLLRRLVNPIRSRLGRERLLWTADHTPRLSSSITPREVEDAQRTARSLLWSREAKEALEAVLSELAKEGIRPGDRRQFKTVGVVKAFAFLNGADEVHPEHLEVAQHCLWDVPDEQPVTVAQVIARIANPTGMRVTQLLLEAESVLAATDVRNLADAAKAAAKLAEIDKQLASLSGNGRVEKARVYLKDQLKKLKLELAPYNADRLGAPRAMTLRSGEPGRFNIRINDDDMEFGDLEDFEPFGDFDFDFDMEGLPPEAKAELERALRNAREQAREAQTRAFTLRRDAQGEHELHELKIREQSERVRDQSDRLRAHAERLSTDNRDRALEMQKLEERLAKLRELGDDDRLFRAAPNGRAFIIEREGDARGFAEVKPEIQELMVQRDSLTARNRELEARVDQLERKLEELMKRLEKNESGKTR